MLTITFNNLCLLGPLTEVHYNAFPIERQDITPYAVLSQHPNQLNYKELDKLLNTLHARTVQTSTLWRARRTAPNPITTVSDHMFYFRISEMMIFHGF